MLIQARTGVGSITSGRGGGQEGSTYVFLMSKSINLILGNSASLSLEMIMLIS